MSTATCTPPRHEPHARPQHRSGGLRRLGVVLVVGVAAGLGGCGSLKTLSAEVSSYGQWPADRTSVRYAFERLPSQQVQADFQARVEAAAAPALAAKGFSPVAMDQADVLVQVAAQARVIENDPWVRRDGWLFGGVFGVGGGVWGRNGGVGIGINFDTPRTQMQVDLLIRDRRSSQTLYETHAVHVRPGGVVESLMAPMFDAALKDFPTQAVSPRVVTVDIPAPPASKASTP